MTEHDAKRSQDAPRALEPPGSDKSAPDKPALDKLDPRSRRRLRRGEIAGPIEALVRTELPPSADEAARLEAAGWQPRSSVAQVLSGTVSGAKALEALVELPFVRQVELSRPLREETDEQD